jgi:putative peptidoglycan lipid II flippase
MMERQRPAGGEGRPEKESDPRAAGERAGRKEGTQAASNRHATLVASGIFLSRIAGLLRDRVFAYYFGSSDAADIFRAAFRIPNLLQNLFGEGALSASFIPVYANLLARKQEDEADEVASAIFCMLALTMSCLVVAGILAAPFLTAVIAPGFTGEKLDRTIFLVRILFPGAGLLAISAWCLGILNSHRRFFISDSAPVAWNVMMILSMVAFGGRLDQVALTKVLAWGSVAGSALQIGVQLPFVLRLMRRFSALIGLARESVRTVVRNFPPMLVSRGVVQISAYIDTLIASFLPAGALAAIVYAQTLYILPVSLFGMSVSAAELPAFSSALGDADEVSAYLRARLNAALRSIAFFVVPSAVAFFALGDVVVGAIYQTGRFGRQDSIYVWAIIAGYAIGILATTCGRLYASAFYALRDTRTPLGFAVLRVCLAASLGYAAALHLPHLLGFEARWGAAGLTASAGIAGWLELVLLRSALNHRIGPTGLAASFSGRLWLAAAIAAAAGWGVKLAMHGDHPIKLAAACLGLYGAVYFSATAALRVPEMGRLIGKAARLAKTVRR